MEKALRDITHITDTMDEPKMARGDEEDKLWEGAQVPRVVSNCDLESVGRVSNNWHARAIR